MDFQEFIQHHDLAQGLDSDIDLSFAALLKELKKSSFERAQNIQIIISASPNLKESVHVFNSKLHGGIMIPGTWYPTFVCFFGSGISTSQYFCLIIFVIG